MISNLGVYFILGPNTDYLLSFERFLVLYRSALTLMLADLGFLLSELLLFLLLGCFLKLPLFSKCFLG